MGTRVDDGDVERIGQRLSGRLPLFMSPNVRQRTKVRL